MSIYLGFLAALFLGLFIAMLLKNRQLAVMLEKKEAEVAQAHQNTEQARKFYEEEHLRIYNEAQAGVIEAQKLIDQQLEGIKLESDRIRQHYENELQRLHGEDDQKLTQALKDLEQLRKYECVRDAQTEAERVLNEALNEATSLRQQATVLLEKAHSAAAEERAKAIQRAKDMRQEADALLNQATQESGRIIDEANSRAKQIAGDAYDALRDKELLEQAARAMQNVVDGYGDRYIIPTRSILDDLASDFGHTAAGESLRLARDQSRRMVEQGQAAECEYVETYRRETAIRFVIDAFNGRVDAILSRVKHDNLGTLEQEIRDAYSLVNLNGKAFRNAQIRPSYLEARLAELKWAVVVQELRLKDREEQQRIREQIREEEKARRDYERAMRDAEKEEEILRKAMATAQLQAAQATSEQKAKYEQRISELADKLKEAEEKNQRAISMAQQTRRGHVYIISNIGSLGENVYKIGLTRRLEPMDRIHELGDSSVPFEFDVHALIFSEDAPALETRLHKHFVTMQVNKMNHRKEFFRVDLKHIREEIEGLGIETKWTMAAQAAEYKESQAIEKAISADPAKLDAWIRRQLELEPLERDLEGDSQLLKTDNVTIDATVPV